jgi:hypothetical protein
LIMSDDEAGNRENSSGPASTENNKESFIAMNSAKDQEFVLGELLIALMRNRGLSEAEGKAML